MTDRERWIVYPLLLLALGASLRNKLTRTIDTDKVHVGEILYSEKAQVAQVLDAENIQCRRLTLMNEDGKPLMAFGPNRDGTFGVIESKQGALNINGPVLAKAMRCEELAIVDRDGQRCMTLDVAYKKNDGGKADTHSGRFVLFDAKNKPQVAMARSPVGGTVTAYDDAGKGVIIGHVQPNPGVRWAGLFTIGSDGKIRKLGTNFDPGVDPKKEEKPMPEEKEKTNDQGPMPNDQ